MQKTWSSHSIQIILKELLNGGVLFGVGILTENIISADFLDENKYYG